MIPRATHIPSHRRKIHTVFTTGTSALFTWNADVDAWENGLHNLRLDLRTAHRPAVVLSEGADGRWRETDGWQVRYLCWWEGASAKTTKAEPEEADE